MPENSNQNETEKSYEGLLGLSRDLAAQRKLDAALEYARRAIALDPSRPEGFNLLGAYSEARGKKLEAQKYYRAATDLDPSFTPARNNLRRLIEKGLGPVDLG